MTLSPPPPALTYEGNVARFLVAHYPNNADGTPPDVWDLTLYSYPCACARANALMVAAGYAGCCTITGVTATYVFVKNT